MTLEKRRNQYDHQDCLESGDRSEELLRIIYEQQGYKAIKANKYQDINEHWDYEFSKDQESFKVDVKAIKRIHRHDTQKQVEFQWIELHSVRPKNQGWLYDGKADYIAFELTDRFMIVNRIKLIELVESLLENSHKVYSARDALYNLYQRRGRCDLLTLIKTSDLLTIDPTILSKL